MTEIGAASGAVIAAGWTGRKLLGPLFDEIAEDWRERYSDHRKRNLNRIGAKAQAKLGAGINEEGQVPPRVVLRVMEDGSWCDASVMAEYFGGILAASRSKDGVDDRGASWAALVSRPSTYDVYLHYLAYDAFRRIYKGRTDLSLGVNTVRDSCGVYLPAGDTLAAMGLELNMENFGSVVAPSMISLMREGLLGDQHSYGSKEWISEKKLVDAPEAGVVFTPSVAGVDLFFWAHGHGSMGANAILSGELALDPQENLGTVAGAQTIEAMKKERIERVAREAGIEQEDGVGLDGPGMAPEDLVSRPEEPELERRSPA